MKEVESVPPGDPLVCALVRQADPASDAMTRIRPAPTRLAPTAYQAPVLATPKVSTQAFIDTDRGTIQLELAVLDDESSDRMRLGQLFQNVLCGGDDLSLAVLHGLGEKHFVEENVAELLGRVDVESLA